jgi:hypothetical protein
MVRMVDQGYSALGDMIGLLPRMITLVGQLEQTMAQAQEFESTLRALEPSLRRIAEIAEPGRVDAAVRMLDTLPGMVDRVASDVLPLVESLRNVGPDIRDLLDTNRDLNDMVGSVPGLRHVSRRIDENERLQDEHWADNLGKTRKNR